MNALLFSVSRIMAAMADDGLLPSRLSGSGGEPRLAVIVVALGPAAMMALGMAGEPVTEIYALGAFLFWLLLFGAVDFSLLRLRRSQHLPLPMGVLVSFLGMMAAVVALLISVPEGLVREVCLLGGRDGALARLAAYREAGADLPVVYPVPAGEAVPSILGSLSALAPGRG